MDKVMRYAGPSAEAQLINSLIDQYERYNNSALLFVYWDYPFFFILFLSTKEITGLKRVTLKFFCEN